MKITEKKRTLISTLRTKNIHNSVLLAIEAVPRELFVESDMVNFCYDDNALPIACGQTISQPYTVAYMTQLLEIIPSDKILEIGTGSGYQTAILHQLCKNIYTVERIPELANSAYLKFKKLVMGPTVGLNMHHLQK